MKTALVTGASRGIGAETAKIFAQNGFRVYLNFCKSVDKATNLKNQLQSQGFDVHLLEADVSDAREVQNMLHTIERYSKHLDVLVNNAGVALCKQIQDTTEADFDFVTLVNQKGVFLVTKFALPLLEKSAMPSIVNVSSIWGLDGASCESVYSMSKAAVVGFSQALGKEFEGKINVNCVCPGFVRTDMCKDFSDTDIKNFEKQFGKVLQASEVAQTIFSVATDQKSQRVLKI